MLAAEDDHLAMSDDEFNKPPPLNVINNNGHTEVPLLPDDCEEVSLDSEPAPSKLRLDLSDYNPPSITAAPAVNPPASNSVPQAPFGGFSSGPPITSHSGFGFKTEAPDVGTPSSSHVTTTSMTSSSLSNPPSQPSPPLNEQPYVMEIRVESFEKRGEGMNAYLVYKVCTQSQGVQGVADRSFEVWRRFSDFLGLREKLAEKYVAKGVVVPPAPEKSIAAMTKTKTTSSESALSHDVALRRSRQLERFIRRVVLHPRMRVDCDVRDFLTMDGDLPKSSNTAALSGAGMKRMFKSVGDVFSKMAFHMEEGDRWFEQTQSHIDELDESLRKLLTLAENLTSTRRDLSSAQEGMSKGLSMLASCEESTALARALSHLNDAEESAAEVWARQAEMDSIRFTEAIGEYVGLLASLKEVFNERVRVWQSWQTAQQNLAKKREQKARLELSGRTDRVSQMKDEMDEATQRVDALEAEFGEFSKLIRDEVARFENQRRHDMKQILINYLESLIATHTEMLKIWEKFEPETKAIIA